MKASGIIGLGRGMGRDLLRRVRPTRSHEVHIRETVEWLCRAQDATADDGVSEGYHLYHGWLPSYPETSGYIIETLFDYASRTDDGSYRQRALRVADWLTTIQDGDGAIPDSYFKRTMVFDTGQALFGFVRAFRETGDGRYREAAVKAGAWLRGCMEDDGTWVRHSVNHIPHTYYSRVAWSMLELHRVTGDGALRDAATRHIRWVMAQQRRDGWFDKAAFTLADHAAPFTHTIAYTIRGVLECGLYLEDRSMLDSSRLAADGLLEMITPDGRLPGTFRAGWEGDSRFTCLTGNAQLSIIYTRLARVTGDERYAEAARKLNAYSKTRQDTSSDDLRRRGAIPGSSPIWGRYIHFCYPNWAAKFFADALMLEAPS